MRGLGVHVRARYLHRGLQAVIVGVLVAGIALPNVSMVVNGGVALVATALPALIRRDFDVHLEPWLTLWLSTAVALHALGIVVLYDLVPWWDHLTHLVSGTLVAAVAYVGIRTLEEHTPAVARQGLVRGLLIVGVTLALAIVWEGIEHVGRDFAIAYGREPVLVVYGPDDTFWDIVFGGLGGLVVALGGSAYFEATADAVRERFGVGET